jgi:hypothetical protein
VENVAESGNLVGLLDDAAETVFLVVGHNGVVRIAVGDNGQGLRLDLQEILEGFLAAHATGNGKIHDQQIKGLSCFSGSLVFFDGLRPIHRKVHRITEMREDFAGHLPHPGAS